MIIIDLNKAREQYSKIENRLEERIIGQREVKEAILDTLKRDFTGIRNEEQPVGAFLCVGPTGTGKTEVAKVVSNTLFDGNLVRFDMNEFMDLKSVNRLIGTPPDSGGEDRGGQLTRALQENPECVLLFDEFEKAHDKVYDVFLRILDEGEFQDQNGTLVSCRDTLIILTSNAGQEALMEAMEQDMQRDHVEVADKILGEIRNTDEKMRRKIEQHFRPEFLNRLDDVLYYEPLSEEDLMAIMDIHFNDFKDEIREEEGLDIDITRTAKEYIIGQVYDPRYGARPLERGMNEYVRGRLATYLMQEFDESDSNKKLVFKKDGEADKGVRIDPEPAG